MLAAKDSKPSASSEMNTTPDREEHTTPTPQPSGLGELAALTTLETSPETPRGPGVLLRAQVSPQAEADRSKGSHGGSTRKSSPTPATRPKRYALELWVEIEVSPGMYGTLEDDSYGVDFVIEMINEAYPGCTGMYLDIAGHMVAFFGKKANT